MSKSQDSTPSAYRPWPHRWAVLLVCATFPLIWVGSLVTTYDAGMAVPDWPGTYGYNLFLYPWQTWLLGPWDLFIEHGHRLLGATVGLITIGLLVTVWHGDSRDWMRWVTSAALGLVIFQGVLGGLRVQLDDGQLAKIHGCVGPAFFALAVAIAVFTSKLWQAPPSLSAQVTPSRGGAIKRLACMTALLAYLQLVIGAHLRHLPVNASPGSFRALVFFHLILAAAVTAQILFLTMSIFLLKSAPSVLLIPAICLCGLVILQLLLGTATWVTKYSWPAGLPEPAFLVGYTIESKGWWQSHIVTAHVATGSVIVVTLVQLTLRLLRLLKPGAVGEHAALAVNGAVA